MDQTFTVSEIARFIGEKPRTVQFWAEVGVLRPIEESFRKGKGVHRRFSRVEIDYANVAHLLSATNSPIGEIESVLHKIRNLSVNSTIDSIKKDFDSIQNDIKNGKGIQKNKLWSLYIDMIGQLGLIGGFVGSIYLIVVYHGCNGEISYTVRFCSDKYMKREIENWASIGIENYIGFKAIFFKSPEHLNFHIKAQNAENISVIREGAQKLMVMIMEMLLSSMKFAASGNLDESYGSG